MEGEAELEAFGAGAGEEGFAEEMLGVGAVAGIELADEADHPDLAEGDGDDAAFEVEQLKHGGAAGARDEAGGRQIAVDDGGF